MFKSKAFLVITVIMLTLAVFVLSCAPAASTKPAEKPAATTPAEKPAEKPAATTPSSTPPTPPTTPAAPAPVAIKTSFEAATYTNDAPAFTMMYPKNWVKKAASADAVFTAVADDSQTADSVSINVIATAADKAAAVKAIIDGSGAFKQYSVTSKIESQKEITLADGKTKALEVVLSAKIVIYDVYLYCVGLDAGGKTIGVVSYTLKNDDSNKKLIKEIAQTLSVK